RLILHAAPPAHISTLSLHDALPISMAELRMVDYGDAPVLPADAARTHEAIERTVGEVVAAGAIPIVLGGDHSIAEPDIRACAGRSEEHTSELQSRENLVCRLLLEKK